MRIFTKNKKYKNEAFGAIHETIEGLHESGLVDKVTMKDFDDKFLVSVEEIPLEGIRGVISE